MAEARGGLGKVVVFKQMYGKTVMTNYPRKVTLPRERQSAAQRGTRDNFRNAAAYAKHVLRDPVQKAYYEKRKIKLGLYSAYQAAITDYMRQLKAESIGQKVVQEQVRTLRPGEGRYGTHADHPPCGGIFMRSAQHVKGVFTFHALPFLTVLPLLLSWIPEPIP